MSVHPSVVPWFRFPFRFRPLQKLTSNPASVSQNVTNRSCLVCIKSEKYASWVTLRPKWDCCRRGEAEVRILNFKTTWSEFHKPIILLLSEAKLSYVYSILKPHGQSSRCQVRLAPVKAKLRCVYSILKPHCQNSITSPELVQTSCVRQHT